MFTCSFNVSGLSKVTLRSRAALENVMLYIALPEDLCKYLLVEVRGRGIACIQSSRSCPPRLFFFFLPLFALFNGTFYVFLDPIKMWQPDVNYLFAQVGVHSTPRVSLSAVSGKESCDLLNLQQQDVCRLLGEYPFRSTTRTCLSVCTGGTWKGIGHVARPRLSNQK